MNSPLNISETAKRYGLDEDLTLKQQLIDFDKFIWQDCQIDTIDKLKEFDDYLFKNKYNPGTTADLTAASIFVSYLKSNF